MSNEQETRTTILSSPRRMWRRAPLPLRRSVNKIVTAGVQTIGRVRGVMERGTQRSLPICIMGLHRAVLGMGRGARMFEASLQSVGVPTTSWDVSALFGDDLTLPAPPSDFRTASTVITHLNPIEHLHALALYQGPRPKPGLRIGYWYWETSRVPDNWAAGISAVDEIWCPSAFTANAIRQLLGNSRPIRVMHLPIMPMIVGASDKSRFNLPTEKVIFFTACDIRSSLNRKNPMGAIKAFELSGCGARGEAELLVKVHGDFPGSGMAELVATAARVPGVRIMNQRLVAEEMRALRSSIDVVLSPHRAEGFGLVLAEAMRAGKPVIATGWSGNMDFMDSQSAALIHSKEVPVDDPGGTYTTGTWAEPDLEHAAVLIQRLANQPSERARLGEAGMRRISAFTNVDAWRGRVTQLLGV